MKRYRGRIIAITTVLLAMIIWNTLYYGINQYPINWGLDILFSIFMLMAAWFLSAYYDRTKDLNNHLKKSKENFKLLLGNTQAVLNNLSEVVFQTDKELAFTVLNPAWATFSGYHLGRSIGTSLEAYIFHEDHPSFLQMFTRNIELIRSEFRYECRIRTSGGGFVWAEMFVKLSFSPNGAFLGATGIMSDVTERKTSEKELIQVNHLLAQQSDRLSVVAQLAAGIAHEVRNPLTSINGFLQLMHSQSTENRNYYDIIFSEIKRIELILSELLVLAKPQAVLQKECNLKEILDHVITLLNSNAILYNITILKEYDDQEIWLYCEENQIKQVFINLIKNGIEAMPSGGTVIVHVKQDDQYVSIFVQDQGIGMKEDLLKNIGQPFFTTKDEGTGLGLTICFKIVEHHLGNINITSKLNEGSTFEVSLPIHKKTS
ncbi:ATP-binding protein [Bacillus sp. DJP31]|uniref:ATP-binding protein n=1 Tax=Bacillus sp. DJP31 TaxID=3409789 RepID=UPI003BB68333